MNNTSQMAFDLTEQGLVPDIVIRRGIRHLLKQRLKEISAHDIATAAEFQARFVSSMSASPIALLPEKANEQHYEIPSEFYHRVLGKHLKYSSALWGPQDTDLTQAEATGLRETAAHAQLEDGQRILELGCGWGSLTLWMAEHYPNANITAISNSSTQRQFIEARAQANGYNNINIITSDMNDFDTESDQFDRVVSVEMFEHMRNWQALYERISSWLVPDGLFFKHIFVHRSAPYLFEDKEANDWMSRHFFSGGMMPSDDLPFCFSDDLQVIRRWRWDGRHYEKTANAWLSNMDRQKDRIQPLFENIYGIDNTQMWWTRWRIFFMACAELFGYDNGQEWFVSHYLLKNRK